MHLLEPHYNWLHLYSAAEDDRSPFYGREYSEFEFSNTLYDHVIHPQWDEIGSPTLFIKLLYVEYDEQFAIIELLGEWNDCINNDIMTLKRDIIEPMMEQGINKFILIGENVLNFHASDDCYYEEWFDDIADGWIAFVNFRDHVLDEFHNYNIDTYVLTGGALNEMNWRTLTPTQFYQTIEKLADKRLELGGI